MNISFDLYKVFYYVCKYMSVTEAAKNLYVSQPAITKQIKNLENGLSKTLFIRSKKGIKLTEEGRKLYDNIKDSVEKLEDIESSNNESKSIRIVAGYSTIRKKLIKAITSFNEKFPEIKFELSSYNYHESIDKLKEGSVDLIFLNMKKKDDIELKDLNVNKLYIVHDIFIKNKKMDNIPDKIDLIDLNKYPVICKSGKSIARQNIEDLFLDNNLIFKPKYELSNNWLIEEYVNMNLGIGLVTKEFILDELSEGKFIEIDLDQELPFREIGYATRKSQSNSKIIKDFVNELRLYN